MTCSAQRHTQELSAGVPDNNILGLAIRVSHPFFFLGGRLSGPQSDIKTCSNHPMTTDGQKITNRGYKKELERIQG